MQIARMAYIMKFCIMDAMYAMRYQIYILSLARTERWLGCESWKHGVNLSAGQFVPRSATVRRASLSYVTIERGLP